MPRPKQTAKQSKQQLCKSRPLDIQCQKIKLQQHNKQNKTKNKNVNPPGK